MGKVNTSQFSGPLEDSNVARIKGDTVLSQYEVLVSNSYDRSGSCSLFPQSA
jgi:hypothetical protein